MVTDNDMRKLRAALGKVDIDAGLSFVASKKKDIVTVTVSGLDPVEAYRPDGAGRPALTPAAREAFNHAWAQSKLVFGGAYQHKVRVVLGGDSLSEAAADYDLLRGKKGVPSTRLQAAMIAWITARRELGAQVLKRFPPEVGAPAECAVEELGSLDEERASTSA